MSETVIVRFAPSPTGHLHIGGVRTALFNWLFARQRGGKFLLRIEDTDKLRSTAEYEHEIIASMEWLGLTWDDGLLRQSERLDLYRSYAEMLVANGSAYRVDDTTPALKFRMPKEKVFFYDLVHGKIEFDSAQFEDLVIMKSDGFPTWTFGCIVDDIESGITHVIRGDDHISNTPRQILLARALGKEAPKYGHLPLIFGSDGTPLSKRHGATSLAAYKALGYTAEGLLNYLALLGWGPADNKEFYRRDDLVKAFSMKRVNNTNGVFDPVKLNHVNGLHLKAVPVDVYVSEGTAYARSYHPERLARVGEKTYAEVLRLYRERIKCYDDVFKLAGFVFDDAVVYEEEAVSQHLHEPSVLDHLAQVADVLDTLPGFDDHGLIEKELRSLAEKWGIKAGLLIHPLRVALTGKTVSPGIFEVMSLLGKEKVVGRIRDVVRTRRSS